MRKVDLNSMLKEVRDEFDFTNLRHIWAISNRRKAREAHRGLEK